MIRGMVSGRASMVFGRRAVIIDAKIKAATPVEKNYKPGDTGQLYLFVSTAIGAKPSR